ncbi:MAG: fumarate hydratase, partial [Oscillospiraceae bacterium]|nr:fumarate hydratase [Oscillospiraceae bacterium]
MSVREIRACDISAAVEELVIDANCNLPEDVKAALLKMQAEEESELCKGIIGDILKNAEIARECRQPICQDTGLAVFFVELGQDVHIVGGDFKAAMDEGVARGYKNGYLRKSSQDHVLGERVNRGDNTPAICHIEVVPGDKLTITVCPKGGGAENMSALGMLTPSQGWDGVKKFVVDTISKAGANPCPPVIVGCAAGGTIEQVTLLAKKALCRKAGEPSADPEVARMEKEILEEINKLGIGAQGFGGTRTALAVHMLTHPVHLATLPVA